MDGCLLAIDHATGRIAPWSLTGSSATSQHFQASFHHNRGRMQVSLPIAMVDGCPLGLGLMGPRGSDEDLLRLAGDILALLRQPSADVGGAAAGR